MSTPVIPSPTPPAFDPAVSDVSDAGSAAGVDRPRWGANARPISLCRYPATAAASALTTDVAALLEPYLPRTRSLGAAGRATHQAIVGTLLGGILKGTFRDHAVSARQGKAGQPWSGKIGQAAFWGKVRAMEAAGLVEVLDGIAYKDGGMLTGKPAKIRARIPLLTMAKNHKVTREGFASDWPLTSAAERARHCVLPADLLVCYEPPPHGSNARHPAAFPQHQAAEVEERRAALLRLNAHLAAATVAGCQPPILRAQFFGDVRLHGRLYVQGEEGYQWVPRADRHTLRLNGRPIVEVDFVASQLAIFLAAAGCAVPGDPYSTGGIEHVPREAVKRWVAQRLNSTELPIRWSPAHSAAVRSISIKVIQDAVLTAYPALIDPAQFLPPDMEAVIPIGRRGWAVGQWLTGMEADVLGRAVELLMEQCVVALPLFDALLVNEVDAKATQEAMKAAFRGRTGGTVGVRVKEPPTPEG